ncbi:MAG: ComEC/Rec2 family competence protein, partial [Candidatus Aminicenantes bacterium]|nr:ComEC/Rec2 family competence protein [Candidatus Aminicenantes bacterium]
MAFPLFLMAVPFAGGIWLGSSAVLEPAAWAVLAALFLAAAWGFFLLRKTTAPFFLALAVCGALGAGLIARAEGRSQENPLSGLPRGIYADFTGTLLRSPGRGIERDDFLLRVASIRLRDRNLSARGILRVSIPHSAEFPGRLDVLTGDRVTVSAQIQSPREYRNFDEPFYPLSLKIRGINAQASTKSPLLVVREDPGRTAFVPLRLVSRLRQAFQRSLERFFPSAGPPSSLSPEGAVLEALILGERGRMDPATARDLQRTGIFHLFAISGAHVGIVAFLAFLLLKAVRIPARASHAAVLAVLLAYALLVEGRPSVVRAVAMASIYILGKIFWKDAHPLNALGIGAVLILLANPFQLFEAGFQMTFGATLGIILLFPRIRNVLPRLPLRISELFGVSLAAQAAVFPILARSFHRVVFSGVLLNLIAVPLAGLIMAAGYVFLPLSLAAPDLAGRAAGVMAFLVRTFLASSRLLDGLPFLSFRVPTPPASLVLAYLAGLGALLLPARFRPVRRAGGAVALAAFLLVVIHPFPSSVRDLTVTVLDVGQGDSILVEFPGRAKMLVDGGGLPVGGFDIGEHVVSPFLWNKGIKRLDLLVLSHAHPDHLHGLAAVAENFRVGEFWETSAPPADKAYDRLNRALAGVRRKRVARGEAFTRGGVDVDVLSPPACP